MMKIRLTPCEQELARAIARARYATARRAGLKNAKVGPQSNEDTDLEGAGAEIVFAKAFNLYPQMDSEPPIKNEDGQKEWSPDALTRHGYSVDIKATKYERGHLICVPWRAATEADLYVLITGRFPSYRIAGFLPAKELLKKSRLKPLVKERLAFTATQKELMDIKGIR